MFRYDEAMTDLVLTACRDRLSLDPVSLDFGGLVASLDAGARGARCARRATTPAQVLELFVEKLSTAVVSCDSPRFLSFIPAAPTKASLLFDMFVSCSSLHGTSWLEAAGVVVAENQALGVLAERAGFPAGAGGCFVAGGSAGNLSALMVARDTAAHRRQARRRRYTPSSPISDDAHSSVGKALHVLGVGVLTVPTIDHRLTGHALRAALRDDPRRRTSSGWWPRPGRRTPASWTTSTAWPTSPPTTGLWFHIDGAYGGAAALFAAVGPRRVHRVRPGRLVHRRSPQMAVCALRLRGAGLPPAQPGQGGAHAGRAVSRGPAQREPRGVEPERLRLPPHPPGPRACPSGSPWP